MMSDVDLSVLWKTSVAGGDRESEVRCTWCGIGMMHDIATTHGTCGKMSDGADGADSDKRSSIIGRTMLHRACMAF